MTSIRYLWYSLYGSFTVLFKNILKCLLTITACVYYSACFIMEKSLPCCPINILWSSLIIPFVKQHHLQQYASG